MNVDDSAILQHAVEAYGFLLNQDGYRNRAVSWGEFIALIRRAYNYQPTPRTSTILTVIERARLATVGAGSR